ncbi:MAG: hypothetical protein A2636_04295 [Elusimicrobia bacterium RIFCSPHIGHO2_01_FULL_64_10]|nr:MAG: hypothetical protein A2636_04295 [Elusimicrobia bacterium RIFCSPHIGHO2_01_FULL_64_10]
MAKILIADDEPEVLDFCRFSLQKLSHDLVEVQSGQDLIGKIKSEKPDLLILDVMLPGMDGYTVQLQMAEDGALSKIPVIVITALKPAESLFEKFPQVASVLSKPFSSERLAEAVREALSGSRK